MKVVRQSEVPHRLLGALLVTFVLGALGCSSNPGSTTVAVTSVSVTPSVSLTAGGATGALTAKVQPSNATNTSVNWSSSNTAVAIVSTTGVVTPVAPGVAVITVTTTDGAHTATCVVTVTAVAPIAVTGLTLDHTTLDLVAGAAATTLTATVTPTSATNKAVVWQSTNSAVATVSATGDVTPVAAGTATIIAATVDGPKVATCAVKVSAAPIAVTGVGLVGGDGGVQSQMTLNMTANSKATLVAEVTPTNATDKAISWTASAGADGGIVASVSGATDGGMSAQVAALAEGNLTVTVRTHDGAKTATCAIHVSAPTNAVTGVRLNLPRLDLVVGGYPASLTHTVTPANADNPAVTWSTSDATVATVTNGTVTPVGSGVATITVTTVEGSFTATTAVTVHPDPVTSLALGPNTAMLLAAGAGAVGVLWKDPVDLGATGIQVTLKAAGGSVSQVIPVGAQMAVFPGLAIGSPYSFGVRVLGTGGTVSDEVTLTGTPRYAERVLISSYVFNDQRTILNDTFGTASVETHDLVETRIGEIKTDPQHYPMSYRWVLRPGLTNAADTSLVSLRSEEYKSPDGGPTKEWVVTDRYLTIRAGAGWSDQGQWNSWTSGWGCISGTTTQLAYADPYDSSDAGALAMTFKVSPSTEIDGGVRFEWAGQPNAYLVHMCLHAGAKTAADVGPTFPMDSSWVLEDATRDEYTVP